MRALLEILWRLASGLEPFPRFACGKSLDSSARLCPYMDHEARLTVAETRVKKAAGYSKSRVTSMEPTSRTSMGLLDQTSRKFLSISRKNFHLEPSKQGHGCCSWARRHGDMQKPSIVTPGAVKTFS